jgi:catechol 2,3-dioxygenase-like lactoylglutathione lyase family enzyme
MRVFQLLLLLASASLPLATLAADNPEPKMQRITMATVPSSDLQAFEDRYKRWLGYEVRERGVVSAELAESWGTPAHADSRYLLMSSAASPDVFIRAVEAQAVEGYVPMTTWGWNSIEIIVDDPVKLREQFHEGPFRVIGEPKGLNSYPTIVAFQVQGPDNEVLYLTAETGDRETSTLPKPGGDIGRIFIMVLAGPDIDSHLEWYGKAFDMQYYPAKQLPVGVVQDAQALSAEEPIWLGIMRLAEHGNLIEFDGYSAAHSGPRPFHAGELPPGVASTSFAVPDLDALDLPFIRPPAIYAGKAYDGRRSATVRGPVGELIELIENPPGGTE